MPNLELLISRAIENSEFRSRLITNPVAAAGETGVTFPPGITLVVHEDTANELNLVIGGEASYLGEGIVQLLAHAQQDASFKARLINDPVTTLKADFGVALPPMLKVAVYENTESVHHLVLPVAESPDGELSDLQLEGVAGGSIGHAISQMMKGISHILNSNKLSQLPKGISVGSPGALVSKLPPGFLNNLKR